jgi:hypothetical protein
MILGLEIENKLISVAVRPPGTPWACFAGGSPRGGG